MKRAGLHQILALCGSLGLAACGGEESTPGPETVASGGQDPAQGGGLTGADLGFEVWHEDFPFEVHISPRNRAGRYPFTRRQALRRIVDRLDGNWTRAGYRMARQFFLRAPEDAIPMLIESMDEAMQAPHLQDRVQNTVEAMGRMGRYESEELARALLRALQHRKVAVQNSAMGALAQAGTPQTVLAARRFLGSLQLRAFHDWVRAVCNHLPDQREEILGELLRGEDPRLFSLAAEQALQLGPEPAIRILGPMWREIRGPLKLSLAVAMHNAGEPRGTEYVLATLESEDDDSVMLALGALATTNPGRATDDVLELSMHENAGVRAAVASVIGTLPGDNVSNVLDILAVDPAPDVRERALKALAARGELDQARRLIEHVRTGTGSVLINALADLSAAGIGEAIPVMVQRMRASPPEEWRKFLQAIGRSGADAAFEPLVETFMMPEQAIDRAGESTTMTYAALLLPNVIGRRAEMLDLLDRLPREDYRRRAWILHRLGVVAAESEKEEFRQRVYDRYRRILSDPEEIPQLRLLALEYLRRDLSLDDMQRIKKMQDTETGAMRRALVDFLFEFF